MVKKGIVTYKHSVLLFVTSHIVKRDQVAGQTFIKDLILRIKDQEDQIETRQQGVRQLNIIDNVFPLVPLRLCRICGS